jgi:hypothetical protein
MVTIEEAIQLLANNFVSEMYLPEYYLTVPNIQEIVHHNNWMVLPSVVPGWILLRKRLIYQD